jgi:amino acid transporter
MTPPADGQLLRGLRKWDVVALVINSVVGAGIFGLPSQVFALAGAYSLAAYAAAAVAIGLIVLCFAEVGSRFGATGGPYLYARAAFGPLAGFQVGWLMWVARIAGFASLINLFVTYVAFFVPAASGDASRAAVILTIVTVLAIVNIVGVRTTAAVTNVLTAAKMLPLFALAVAGVFLFRTNGSAGEGVPSYRAFSQAALLLMFAYMGFEGAVIPSGEMRNPRRDLPFALLAGMAVVTLVYIGVQAVCIATVSELAHAQRPLTDAASRVFGGAGASVVALAALVSIGGILNAILFATPRLLFAMAGNGELPDVFARTHARYRTPVAAILATTIVAAIVALFSTFISALTISTIVRLLAYMATCAALPALRRRGDVPSPSFVVAFGALVAASAIALSVWLVSNSAWNELGAAALFVAGGIALYFACTAGRARMVRSAPTH